MKADRADDAWMARCLELAEQGRYRVSPNPLVGAVIVRDGAVVGEGHHRALGAPHAERDALQGLSREQTAGATLYVSLEPCSHQGRTPPCVDAVAEAGFSRVVVAHLDPNPAVAGRGLERLRSLGIEVRTGVLWERAVALNLPFLTRHVHGRPAVTLKWAMTLDGRIATASGESQWISSSAGRDWALDLREEHDAILVGSGTALTDDPRLDRRRSRAEGPIHRVVLDRRLRLEDSASMLTVDGPVTVFTSEEAASSESARKLEAKGAGVVGLGEPFLDGALSALATAGVQSVLVEGGAGVHGAFADAGLFDRIEVCCAPKIFGGREAPGPIAGDGVARLVDGEILDRLQARSVGADVVLSALHRDAVPRLGRAVTEGAS